MNAKILIFILMITLFATSVLAAESFKTDNILIKVLLKDQPEERIVKLTSISNKEQNLEVYPEHLSEIINIQENKFALTPRQTKNVVLTIGSTNQKGIFVGNFLAKSKSQVKNIPLIVEIETQKVLFDASTTLQLNQEIKAGGNLNVELTLFDLRDVGLTNVDIEYVIKDFKGNTILTESSNIAVNKKETFTKTIHLPKSIESGQYVFGIIIKHGDSIGTSSLMFSTENDKQREQFNSNKDNLYWLALIILAVTTLSVTMLIGMHVHLLRRTVHHHILKKPYKKREINKKKVLKIAEITAAIIILACVFYTKLLTLAKIELAFAKASGFVTANTVYLYNLVLQYPAHTILGILIISLIVLLYKEWYEIKEYKEILTITLSIAVIIATLYYAAYTQIITFSMFNQIWSWIITNAVWLWNLAIYHFDYSVGGLAIIIFLIIAYFSGFLTRIKELF
ncbi:hypothetical protein HN592_01280 [Candidatus Woesearchaeota archaeon]|jgi:hypothetical protein|nr:hypothetical protein [Candidatus Woesearchaeota archaeon]MBT4368741.1 hypothetical protein [Candidatus Woesearchaeota archaeon]MBT4712030.1 hypothetical protein [Candidatus Woesearchaeota archaeon]MBT6638925.1 hypothetical protein [Candidatus Woesearchaeota archaeon]MBT7134569.1 hypothetical protein [Candidatus Woesearchaeota archaeon]